MAREHAREYLLLARAKTFDTEARLGFVQDSAPQNLVSWLGGLGTWWHRHMFMFLFRLGSMEAMQCRIGLLRVEAKKRDVIMRSANRIRAKC
jgi:hypothetical protein